MNGHWIKINTEHWKFH